MSTSSGPKQTESPFFLEAPGLGVRQRKIQIGLRLPGPEEAAHKDVLRQKHGAQTFRAGVA